MINNNFHNKLQKKEFVFTAETSPPDSTVKSEITDRVSCLKDLADAINITDGASAKSHLSSLVVSSIIKDFGIEPIMQLTTRDRNRIALQSDLLGAWTLKIQNILCIYGDLIKTGDQPDAKEVRDLDTLGIINTANHFKTKKTFPSGRTITSAPEFFIGGADTPFEIDEQFDCSNLIKKIQNGVNFFQTQYAFDYDILKIYMNKLREYNVTKNSHYLVGLGVIKSAKSAKWMNKNLFGIDIPEPLIRRLENSKNETQEGINICIELIEKYKEIDGIHGIHLMGYHQEKQIASVISHFKK